MDGYMLDTNVVLFMMRKRKSRHEAVWRRHDACPDGTPFYVSPVALGECDVGCILGTDDTETARQEIAKIKIPAASGGVLGRKFFSPYAASGGE